jgi:hypothetical protein
MKITTEILAGGASGSRRPYEAASDPQPVLPAIMKAGFSLQTARRALRDSLLCVWLWLLAAGLPVAVLGQVNYAAPYTFTPLAGYAHYGSWDGTGSAAQFNFPFGVAVDGAGNVFVGDQSSHTIRKVTPAGVVTTLAGSAGNSGSADGTGSAARFYYPGGVAVDTNGNLYVADWGNHTIRKVMPVATNWVVTTLAGLAGSSGANDGTGSAAQFYSPQGVAVDSAGNVYAADSGNNTIRKVTPAGVVTTLAGSAGNSGSADGTNSAAQFNYPLDVAVDSAGNVYVADSGNSTIRKVTPAGVVTTLAGSAGNWDYADGTGTNALFNGPEGVAVDSAGNVYVADVYNNAVRKVTPAGVVTTLAGSPQFDPAGTLLFGSADGTGSAAQFYYPEGVALDKAGNVYVADCNNCTIRKVTPAGVVTTLAGSAWYGSADGTGSAARFFQARGLAVDSAGNVYVADTPNYTVRKVTPAGVVTTLAGLAGAFGYADGTGTNALFERPECVTVDTNGNLYVTDGHADTIRKVTPTGVVTTLAGSAGHSGSADGTGTNALFSVPWGVAVDSAGTVYVADTHNYTIRKVTPVGTNWVVTTLAGSAGNSGSTDGTGTNALFGYPEGLAVDSAGNVYVADSGNNTIRKVTPPGVVTTMAGSAGNYGYADGTGTNALFSNLWGVAVDNAGNAYVTDWDASTIRKVTPAGVVTTLGGLPVTENGQEVIAGGLADGTGSAARFSFPTGVAVDSAGNLYVSDAYNSNIRKGFPASSVPAPLLQPPSLSAGQFGFGITGLPNLAVDIESSGDFSQWQVVGTVILEGGTTSFVSPTPPQGIQFYRGRVR